jgi:hypothetical protein
LNKKGLISILLILTALTSVLVLFVPSVKAVGVKIISVSPVSLSGYVGDKVVVAGTINTTNGLCQIRFGNQLVNETHAIGNNVSAAFLVPQTPRGNYTLMLKDVSANLNASTSFQVYTAHYIQVKVPTPPKQLQEGDRVGVWVNVTGADANATYVANVTVTFPTPINTVSWTLVKFNSTGTGEGYNLTAIYPDSFHGTADTNFTGVYKAAFNSTLATATFTVGLTNSTQYHRFQYVDIKAAAYRPGENVTVKILSGTETLLKENVTAGSGRFVNANWTVPSNASIGTYTLNITSISSTPTKKSPPDIQAFIVPGFSINITARNLAGDPVPSLDFRVYQNNKSVINSSSDQEGFVPLQLEIGTFLCNATFKSKKVGELTINVANAATYNFTCLLTDLRVLIINGLGVQIPGVAVFLKPDNRTLALSDINGTIVERSMLPIVTSPYILNVSRYGQSFNVTNIPTLLVNGNTVPWYNVTIVCPTLKLQVNVTGVTGRPISNVKVKVRESMGGIFNEGNTSSGGIAMLNCTFGEYAVEVDDALGVKLGGTFIDLFKNGNISIKCPLYDLTLSVKVADYFGQPVSNANVTIQLGNLISRWNLTQSKGTATFYGLDGGTYVIAVLLSGQTEPFIQQSVGVGSSNQTVSVRVDKYVMLAGSLVEASQLGIAVVIAVTIFLALLIEVYRRTTRKARQSPKLESE